MGPRIGGLLALVCLSGCASSRLILEKPVADQCTSVGLEGCPQLTEGVLLYVEGNAADAKPKIIEGAKANVPDKITDFASSLEMLGKIPGADSYMGPVREIIAVLSQIAKERAKEEAAKRTVAKNAEAEEHVSKKRRAVATEGAPVIDVDLTTDPDDGKSVAPHASETETGTLVPAMENGAEPCQIGAFVPTLSPVPGLCLRAITGPILVTDLHASGECPSDLFVLGGSKEGARWLIKSPAKTPLHVTGGRLLVRPFETLTVGISANAHADMRCALTWSGERPWTKGGARAARHNPSDL